MPTAPIRARRIRVADFGPIRNFFRGMLKTRPYVRIVKMLTSLAYEVKQCELVLTLGVQLDKSSAHHMTLPSLPFIRGRHSGALSFCQKWFHPDSPRELGGTAFDPPHRDMISVAEVDEMIAGREEEYGIQGAVLHTATLAAFRLWGDCPESRQYIGLAPRIDPLILFKILGRIAIPSTSTPMRLRKGAEDAQSYLWRMQDTWNKAEICAWANGNAAMKMSVRHICSGCDAAESDVAAFKRCAGYHLVSHCTSACQRAEWPNPKECMPFLSLEIALPAIRNIQGFSILSILAASAEARIVQRATESITFSLEPAPTVIDSAVVSAYSAYVEKCGTDLDAIAYSALPGYIEDGNPADTTILDPAFLNFLENDGKWQAGKPECPAASSAFENALGERGQDVVSRCDELVQPPDYTGAIDIYGAQSTETPGSAVAGQRPDSMLIFALLAAVVGQIGYA
ncbi:hypothetical protein B0H17DRAFT_1200578 [Mycena rosella]|uniref:Uncharacterized protein n=1 Tax=Mycena rosella TaxID=1033263 RepID=A0AAD7DLD3_MYCRO|nr:hypothetical protein B0H17DRAFT_1200578 [Mycena rosella]